MLDCDFLQKKRKEKVDRIEIEDRVLELEGHIYIYNKRKQVERIEIEYSVRFRGSSVEETCL